MDVQIEFAENNQVWWPITINVPRDGGPKEMEAEVLYTILTKTEAQRIAVLSPNEAGEAMLDQIHDWRKFADVHGKDIPFTRENLLAVLDFSFIEAAISKGWRDASRGAPTKNL